MSDNRSQENDRPFMVRETETEKKKDEKEKETSKPSQKPKNTPKSSGKKKEGQSDTEKKKTRKKVEKAPVVNKENIEDPSAKKEAYYEEMKQNRTIINSEIVADASDDLLDLMDKKSNREEILYDRLLKNKEEGKIVYGQVAGVQIDSQYEKVIITVLWNGIRILVPDSAYFQSSWNMGNNFNQLSKEEQLMKIMRNAREMLGSNCPLIIKGVFHDRSLEKTVLSRWASDPLGRRNTGGHDAGRKSGAGFLPDGIDR